MPADESTAIELVQLIRGVTENESKKENYWKSVLLNPQAPTLNFPNYFPSGVVSADAPFAPLPQTTLSPALLKSFYKAVNALKNGVHFFTPPVVVGASILPPAPSDSLVPAVPAVSEASVIPIAPPDPPAVAPPTAPPAAVPVAPYPRNVHVITVVSSKTACKVSAEIDCPVGNYYPYRDGCWSFVLRYACDYADGRRQEATAMNPFNLGPLEESQKERYEFSEYDVNEEQPVQDTGGWISAELNAYLTTTRSELQQALARMDAALLDQDTPTETTTQVKKAREEEEEEKEEQKEEEKQEEKKESSSNHLTAPFHSKSGELNVHQLLDNLQTKLNVLRSTLYFELPYHRETTKSVLTFDNLFPSEEDIRAHVLKTEAASEEYRLRRLDNQVLQERFLEVYEEYSAKGLGHIEVAFHGTYSRWVDSIEQNGLVIPGQVIPSTGEELSVRSDNGYFGKGVYLTPQLSYSMGYSDGLGAVFICLVLSGRVYDSVLVEEGRGLEPGYDSHRGCDGCEWVIFDTRAVLPIYLMEKKDENAAK